MGQLLDYVALKGASLLEIRAALQAIADELALRGLHPGARAVERGMHELVAECPKRSVLTPR